MNITPKIFLNNIKSLNLSRSDAKRLTIHLFTNNLIELNPLRPLPPANKLKINSIREENLNFGSILKAINEFNSDKRAKIVININIGELTIKDKRKALLEEAKQNIDSGDLPSAIKTLDLLLSVYPDCKEALKIKEEACFVFALKLEAEKKLDLSLEYIETALKLNPQNEDATAKKVEILASLKRYDEAFDCLKKIKNESLISNLINLFIKQFEKDEIEYKFLVRISTYFETIGYINFSIPIQEAFVKINPKNILAHLSLAFLYKKKNEIDNAIDCYKKVLEIDPKNEIAHSNLGGIYYKLGKKEKAVKHFIEQVEISLKQKKERPYKIINKILRIYLFDLKDTEGGIKILDRFLVKEEVAKTIDILIKYIWKRGLYKNPSNNSILLYLYFKMREIAPERLDEWQYSKFLKILAKGEDQRYKEICIEAANKFPNNPKFIFRLAGIYLFERDYTKAISFFQKIQSQVKKEDPNLCDYENRINYVWSVIYEAKSLIFLKGANGIEEAKKLLEKAAEIKLTQAEIENKKKSEVDEFSKIETIMFIRMKIAEIEGNTEEKEKLEKNLKEIEEKIYKLKHNLI